MDKFLKNPLYLGIATMLTLVIVVSLVWDKYRNDNKILFGVVKQKSLTA